MENKWLMFKNYMHNELGITKEDICQWIEDAVEEQAKRMVKNEFDSFDVRNIIKKIITDDSYFGSNSLKREITDELGKQIMSRIKFE
jgi:hypothetical protein